MAYVVMALQNANELDDGIATRADLERLTTNVGVGDPKPRAQLRGTADRNPRHNHGGSSVVMAYIGMAYIGMAYMVMAYIVMAYMVMAYVVMAYTVMAYIVMAYIVMVYIVTGRIGSRQQLARNVRLVSLGCFGGA